MCTVVCFTGIENHFDYQIAGIHTRAESTNGGCQSQAPCMDEHLLTQHGEMF